MLGMRLTAIELDQASVLELESHECRAVRCDSRISIPGCGLAFGQVFRQAVARVTHLYAQIPLHLDDSAAEKCVCSTSDLRPIQSNLKRDVLAPSAESVNDKGVEKRAHLFMTRSS
jgi:hypothetical protein